MKAIISTSILFFIAGVCFAGPQPTQSYSTASIRDLLTYRNITNQNNKCSSGRKISTATVQTSSTSPIIQPAISSASETFTPSPLMNFYKELR